MTAGGSGSSNITAHGTLTIVPGGAINLNGSGVVAFGDVIADTAGAGAVTGCAGGMALSLQAGSHNVKGRFCNLSIFGNYTATGPIVVDTILGSAGTAGILNVLNRGSNLTLSGNRVFVRSLLGGSAGNGTLTMTNSNDSLIVTGNAAFNGAASTGLMTAGNLVVGGNLSVTGQSLDASGTHTTTLNSATGPQTISFGSTMAGHGLNNLTFRGAGLKSFGANANVLGNVLIAASVTTQVSGPVTVRLGGATLTDSTAVVAGAWGVGFTFFTSAPISLPAKMPGNNMQFTTGTTTLSQSLSANNITIDGASTEASSPNGNYLTTNGNSFTARTAAPRSTLTTAGDSLAVGT